LTENEMGDCCCCLCVKNGVRLPERDCPELILLLTLLLETCVTEIKTPNGETQIVIDATSKRNKNKSKSIPAEDPPEVEKSAG
jgi:hypothetical protein